MLRGFDSDNATYLSRWVKMGEGYARMRNQQNLSAILLYILLLCKRKRVTRTANFPGLKISLMFLQFFTRLDFMLFLVQSHLNFSSLQLSIRASVHLDNLGFH